MFYTNRGMLYRHGSVLIFTMEPSAGKSWVNWASAAPMKVIWAAWSLMARLRVPGRARRGAIADNFILSC